LRRCLRRSRTCGGCGRICLRRCRGCIRCCRRSLRRSRTCSRCWRWCLPCRRSCPSSRSRSWRLRLRRRWCSRLRRCRLRSRRRHRRLLRCLRRALRRSLSRGLRRLLRGNNHCPQGNQRGVQQRAPHPTKAKGIHAAPESSVLSLRAVFGRNLYIRQNRLHDSLLFFAEIYHPSAHNHRSESPTPDRIHWAHRQLEPHSTVRALCAFSTHFSRGNPLTPKRLGNLNKPPTPLPGSNQEASTKVHMNQSI